MHDPASLAVDSRVIATRKVHGEGKDIYKISELFYN
jgi:hypothetical protein